MTFNCSGKLLYESELIHTTTMDITVSYYVTFTRNRIRRRSTNIWSCMLRLWLTLLCQWLVSSQFSQKIFSEYKYHKYRVVWRLRWKQKTNGYFVQTFVLKSVHGPWPAPTAPKEIQECNAIVKIMCKSLNVAFLWEFKNALNWVRD